MIWPHVLNCFIKCLLCWKNKNFIFKNPSIIFLESVKPLRYVIDEEIVYIENRKTDAILKWPPTMLNKVQLFSGLANYCYRFFFWFSRFTLPLTQFMHKNIPFD